jgi:catecholate siderophore receptor
MRMIVLANGLAMLAIMPAAQASESLVVEDIDSAEPIVVIGHLDPYHVTETGSATKTATPLVNIPQSISTITADQISDQAIRSMAELARIVPGVSAGQGEGHRDQLTLRGNNSTADFFIDGLRDDAQYYRGFYNIERVEALRGPNAMIFGRGGGGGVINRVTKQALLGRNRVDMTGSADSFGAVYGAIDGNAGLSDTVALRLNGFVEQLANHRDAYGGTRWGINPTLAFTPDSDSRIDLSYEHVRDDRVVDRGIPSARTGSSSDPAGPLIGYRGSFFGNAQANDAYVNADSLRLSGSRQLGEGLRLSGQAVYADYDKGYGNAYAATPVSTAGQVGIEAYRDLATRRNAIGQVNLEWRPQTGPIRHVLLFGIEGTDQRSTSERISGFFPTPANARNVRLTIPLALAPAIAAPTFIAGNNFSGNRQIRSTLRQFSLYAQNQASIGDHVQVVAGLRYDRLTVDVTSQFVGQSFSRTESLVSPRLGLVLKPAANASIYGSWSRSFLPQSGDQFVGFDPSFAALEPEAFENWEIGAKWDITPTLALAGALYQLDRTNSRAVGAPGITVLSGAQRTKGADITLVGQITPTWQLSAGYAYTDAKITATTTAAPAGRTVAQTPRHQASLWTRVQPLDWLGVGGGVIHASAQFAQISNSVRLPGYTRLDAALFFDLGRGIEAQVNIENIGNISYFPTAHSDNNITPGAPRNARLTLKTRL